MSHSLYATEPINYNQRKAGIGGKVEVNVRYFNDDDVAMNMAGVKAVYCGKLEGIVSSDDGVGFYLFEGDITIKAVIAHFVVEEVANVTKSQDIISKNYDDSL